MHWKEGSHDWQIQRKSWRLGGEDLEARKFGRLAPRPHKNRTGFLRYPEAAGSSKSTAGKLQARPRQGEKLNIVSKIASL